MSFESNHNRRSEILKAARVCFLDRGYVQTSVKDVAAMCGRSGEAVAREFGNKDGLFEALVSTLIKEMMLPELPSGPPDVVLRALGLAYMERLMDPEALALYRVAIGESAHVRQLGPDLFEAGPNRVAAALSELLEAWNRDGDLQLACPRTSAKLFLAMVEGDLHRSALLWASTPQPEEVTANVDLAVNLFMGSARVKKTQ
jgi:AcrR family transcriptional regulator